jgi:hypothetical protein
MIIIPMAKLSKIFIPELQPLLMRNPQSVFDETPFNITIRTSRRDYIFKYNEPKYEHDPVLINWFCGGDDGFQNQETAWTGLVRLDLNSVQNSHILGAVAGISKIDSSTQTAIEDAKIAAMQLSEQRVMNQIRLINTHMLKQYEQNRQQGQEIYTPSAVEFLCAYILADEKKKEIDSKKEISEMFASLMRKTFT